MSTILTCSPSRSVIDLTNDTPSPPPASTPPAPPPPSSALRAPRTDDGPPSKRRRVEGGSRPTRTLLECLGSQVVPLVSREVAKLSSSDYDQGLIAEKVRTDQPNPSTFFKRRAPALITCFSPIDHMLHSQDCEFQKSL